tara:strand:+ start:720 stop:881 length:162 start_codon:yes stop_codon:yes gene_type:complete
MKSKKLNADTIQVDLLLVRENLTITISLNDFLQLLHGVQVVASNMKGNTIIKE